MDMRCKDTYLSVLYIKVQIGVEIHFFFAPLKFSQEQRGPHHSEMDKETSQPTKVSKRELSGHSDRAPKSLCGDRIRFLKRHSRCVTPPLWMSVQTGYCSVKTPESSPGVDTIP